MHALRSPIVRLRKKWGDCNCCSQKGFYSIQVEKLNTGELVQCFVEESFLAPAFHVVQPQCVRVLNVGVKRTAPHLPRMQSMFLQSSVIL